MVNVRDIGLKLDNTGFKHGSTRLNKDLIYSNGAKSMITYGEWMKKTKLGRMNPRSSQLKRFDYAYKELMTQVNAVESGSHGDGVKMAAYDNARLALGAWVTVNQQEWEKRNLSNFEFPWRNSKRNNGDEDIIGKMFLQLFASPIDYKPYFPPPGKIRAFQAHKGIMDEAARTVFARYFNPGNIRAGTADQQVRLDKAKSRGSLNFKLRGTDKVSINIDQVMAKNLNHVKNKVSIAIDNSSPVDPKKDKKGILQKIWAAFTAAIDHVKDMLATNISILTDANFWKELATHLSIDFKGKNLEQFIAYLKALLKSGIKAVDVAKAAGDQLNPLSDLLGAVLSVVDAIKKAKIAIIAAMGKKNVAAGSMSSAFKVLRNAISKDAAVSAIKAIKDVVSVAMDGISFGITKLVDVGMGFLKAIAGLIFGALYKTIEFVDFFRQKIVYDMSIKQALSGGEANVANKYLLENCEVASYYLFAYANTSDILSATSYAFGVNASWQDDVNKMRKKFIEPIQKNALKRIKESPYIIEGFPFAPDKNSV